MSNNCSPAFQALLARAPRQYRYLRELDRDGWAWEFLRRSDDYAGKWKTNNDLARWGLLAPADPALGADSAPVLWSPEVSGFILPAASAPDRAANRIKPLVIANLRCRVTVMDGAAGYQHALFVDHGRRLQLNVRGSDIRQPSNLRARGEADGTRTSRQFALRRMLGYLLSRATLPPHLYRSANGAYRLLFILLALDAARTGLPPQETSVLLFGDRHPAASRAGGQKASAEIARAVHRGRWLCDGGFRNLLR